MKKQINTLAISTIGSYGLLKSQQSKIDPYTRGTIGIAIGLGMIFLSDKNQLLLFSGIGAVIGSAIQFTDVQLGGKLAYNAYNKPVFVLQEHCGVVELKPNEVPEYPIDGLTIKVLNGVFKVSGGIYAKVLVDGTITETFGIGALLNKARWGIMSKEWTYKQTLKGDSRWATLYEKSV